MPGAFAPCIVPFRYLPWDFGSPVAWGFAGDRRDRGGCGLGLRSLKRALKRWRFWGLNHIQIIRVKGTGQFNLNTIVEGWRVDLLQNPKVYYVKVCISWSYIPRFAEGTPWSFLHFLYHNSPLQHVFSRFFRFFCWLKAASAWSFADVVGWVRFGPRRSVAPPRCPAHCVLQVREDMGKFLVLCHYCIVFFKRCLSEVVFLNQHWIYKHIICHTIKCVLVIREDFGSYFSTDYQLLHR